MPKYTFPVHVTISGYITVEADNPEEAVRLAKDKHEEGVSSGELDDPEWSSEVFYEDMESMEEPKDEEEAKVP